MKENIEPEQKEQMPDINLTMYFSPHSHPKDMGDGENDYTGVEKIGIKKYINETDIFIPELPDHSEQLKEIFQSVSDGRVEVNQAMGEIAQKLFNEEHLLYLKQNNITNNWLRDLYNTHKTIIFCDLPKGHPLVKEIKDIEKTFTIKFNETFEKNLNELLALNKVNVDIHTKRENYIISKIFDEVRKATQERPSLRNKKEVKVLMSMGLHHALMFTDLYKYQKTMNEKSSTKLKTKNIYSRKPYLFTSVDKMNLKQHENKPVSPELKAHCFMFVLVKQYLHQSVYNILQDYINTEIIINKISKKFNYEEIKNLFEKLKNPHNRLETIMFELFVVKKIPSLSSKESIVNFLNSK